MAEQVWQLGGDSSLTCCKKKRVPLSSSLRYCWRAKTQNLEDKLSPRRNIVRYLSAMFHSGGKHNAFE